MSDKVHVQHLRGNTAKNDTFTGLEGEITVDIQAKTARVHDGITLGGYELVNASTAQTIDAVKTFTESPLVPTADVGDNSTKAASTAFVTQAMENIDPDLFPKTSKTNYGLAQVGTGLHVTNGVIGIGEVNRPTVTAPSPNSIVPKSGFTVTGTPFSASYVSDTHKETRWVIYQDGVIVVDFLSDTDLTSHTFTNDELQDVTAGGIVITIQYIGNVAGESEFSAPVDVSVDVASVNEPTITAPQADADVYPSAGITVSTNAFSVSGGSDTHKDTDWMITTGVDRSGVIAQALASADKLNHTFPSTVLGSMAVNKNYFVHARHRGDTLGESPWAVPVQVAAKSGQVAPGDRTVYRHANNKGSVIEYNEFGTPKKLFVADAAYRGNEKWKTSNTAVSGLKQWYHFYSPTCTGNVIDFSTGYVNLSTVADLTPYSAQLSDAHFQAALTATLASVIQTAKAATDLMIADGNCPAAQFVRGKTSAVGIEMQLPNIYQLLVMFACGDIIDSLDPTVAANPFRALGKYGTNTERWRLGGSNSLSSTEYSDTYACTIYNIGRTNYSNKNISFGVVPVAEI